MIKFDEHMFQMGWFNHQLDFLSQQETMDLALRRAWTSLQSDGQNPAKTPRGPSGLVPSGRWGILWDGCPYGDCTSVCEDFVRCWLQFEMM